MAENNINDFDIKFYRKYQPGEFWTWHKGGAIFHVRDGVKHRVR